MYFQVDLRDGATQAGGTAQQKRAVIQKPSENAGCSGGHKTRIHRAEAKHRPSGEQEDETGKE